MGSVRDYGGHSRGALSKIKKETTSSFYCWDCGKMQYVPNRALGRAGRVHCYHCGGPLKETESSISRHSAPSTDELLPLACHFCQKRFRSAAGLELHLRDNHDEF